MTPWKWILQWLFTQFGCEFRGWIARCGNQISASNTVLKLQSMHMALQPLICQCIQCLRTSWAVWKVHAAEIWQDCSALGCFVAQGLGNWGPTGVGIYRDVAVTSYSGVQLCYTPRWTWSFGSPQRWASTAKGVAGPFSFDTIHKCIYSHLVPITTDP